VTIVMPAIPPKGAKNRLRRETAYRPYPSRLVRAASCPAKPAKGQTPDLSLTRLVRSHSPNSERSANGPSPPRRDVGCLYPQCPLHVCAVTRRRFPVGASRTRQPLQPEATGAVMEVTKC
jgi:hypothetical protein